MSMLGGSIVEHFYTVNIYNLDLDLRFTFVENHCKFAFLTVTKKWLLVLGSFLDQNQQASDNTL